MQNSLPLNANAAFFRREAIKEAWKKGLIVAWKCHETQRSIYAEFVKSSRKKFVLNCSRRLGKSYLLCCIAVEQAIKHPNSQIKFAAPTQRQTKKIIVPLMRQILSDCPANLRPRFRSVDGIYLFPNGSEIHIAGADGQNADNLRGTAADLCIVDEAGFVDDLEYLIQDILQPQTLTTGGRFLISSTPPLSPEHPFKKYALEAIRDSSYCKRTIYDNPLLTAETIEEFAVEAGGKESTTWHREYLCEFVTDATRQVIPEATEDLLREVAKEHLRPSYLHPFTAIDIGYKDFTVAALGYYDFKEALLVIEDEVVLKRSNSKQISDAVLAKERALWADQLPTFRIADAPLLTLADLSEIHRFHCQAPAKVDLETMVNGLRLDLPRLRINPRCTTILSHLQFAIWDASRKRFARSEEDGHFDGLAALMYFVRQVDRSNPYPLNVGLSISTHFFLPQQRLSETANKLKQHFLRRIHG